MKRPSASSWHSSDARISHATRAADALMGDARAVDDRGVPGASRAPATVNHGKRSPSATDRSVTKRRMRKRSGRGALAAGGVCGRAEIAPTGLGARGGLRARLARTAAPVGACGNCYAGAEFSLASLNGENGTTSCGESR
jgi:hypothetical protein